MLQKIIIRILQPRHFWRNIGFSELSEIYASMFLRSLALNIIGVFVPIYLYKLGYGLSSIFSFYFIWFVARFVFSFVVAKLIANAGPKHTIAFGTVIHIVYLSLLISLKDLHWPLALLAFIGALATVAFVMAFEVDFSKIKHTEHGGKELGFVHIFDRIGAVVGPLVGGLLASFVDPRYTISLAIVGLAGSLVPIFMSDEPSRTHKNITIKGFPWRRHKRDFISGAAFNMENAVSVLIWPIFISVTILSKNTFATLGALTSIGTAVALLAVYAIGKVVDEQRGGFLLNIGIVANAIMHLFRPFVTGVGQILGINLANEPATLAYRLPYQKGRFDAADSVPGYRIIYFMITDMVLSISDGLFFLGLWLASQFISPILAMKWSFVIAAIASLCISTQRFPALRYKRVKYIYAKAPFIRNLASSK